MTELHCTRELHRQTLDFFKILQTWKQLNLSIFMITKIWHNRKKCKIGRSFTRNILSFCLVKNCHCLTGLTVKWLKDYNWISFEAYLWNWRRKIDLEREKRIRKRKTLKWRLWMWYKIEIPRRSIPKSSQTKETAQTREMCIT